MPTQPSPRDHASLGFSSFSPMGERNQKERKEETGCGHGRSRWRRACRVSANRTGRACEPAQQMSRDELLLRREQPEQWRRLAEREGRRECSSIFPMGRELPARTLFLHGTTTAASNQRSDPIKSPDCSSHPSILQICIGVTSFGQPFSRIRD